MPVLKRPQIGKAVSSTLVDDGVLKDPASAGRIRSDRRMNGGGQTTAYLLQVFHHARACPVEVGAIFKNHIHVGIAEHRLGTYSLHMRGREKTGHDRISDLIFDDVWGLPCPACMHNDLHIGDVGKRIQGYVLQRPDSSDGQKENAGKDQESIAGAETPVANTNAAVQEKATFIGKLLSEVAGQR